MPDFSMCQNKKCPKRKQCLRFTAKPSRYQWYTIPDEPCSLFMPAKKGAKKS